MSKKPDLSELFQMLSEEKAKRSVEQDKKNKKSKKIQKDFMEEFSSEIKKLKEQEEQHKRDVAAMEAWLTSPVEEQNEKVEEIVEEIIVDIPEESIEDTSNPVPVEEEIVAETPLQEEALKYLNTKRQELTEEQKSVKILEKQIEDVKKSITSIRLGLQGQGGGGISKLSQADDIDRATALVNNKFLKYDSSTGKFVGADASGGGGSYGDSDVETLLGSVGVAIIPDTNNSYDLGSSSNKFQDLFLAGTIDVDRLALTSTQTTVPPLQLTATALQDGVGALRIDATQADIFLNTTTANTFSTVTFAEETAGGNAQEMVGFGKNSADDLYFFRETAQDIDNANRVFVNDSFVMARATGNISMGYNLDVGGTITVGNDILPDVTETHDIGSTTKRFNDLFLAGQTIDLGGTKISKDANGDVELKDSSDNLKRIKVDEIEIGSGNDRIKLTKSSSGKLEIQDKDSSRKSGGGTDLVLTDIGITDGSNGQVLTTDGSGSFSFTTVSGGGGIALTDLSVGTENTASGNGAISYSNTTGEFKFTPPAVGDGFFSQNNFTNTLKTKLDGIEASADVTDSTNVVAALTAGTNITIAADGTISSTDTNTTYTVGDGGLTQNNFTNTLKTKLDGIEASADVTDATNVTAAGALMDSEVTNLAQVKAFDSSDYATAAQGTKADSALQSFTETNDLSAAVVWANVPNANITQGSVTQHQAALSITESQISDLGSYITNSVTNTSTDAIMTFTTTEDSSSAGPVIDLKRNSSSPADGDYLGQLKFRGENDADQDVIYAKVTGKISDASDGTEDGLVEIAVKNGGSNRIVARFTGSELKLLNNAGIDVASGGTIDGELKSTATATTASTGDNTTKIATTAFVQQEINALKALLYAYDQS